jgi:hypothetical protein
MYHLTSEQNELLHGPEAKTTAARLIKLFQNMNFTKAEKMDAAYKIVKDAYPELDTTCFLIHARILIEAAKKAAEETIIFARVETPQAAIEALYAEFPEAKEITA